MRRAAPLLPLAASAVFLAGAPFASAASTPVGAPKPPPLSPPGSRPEPQPPAATTPTTAAAVPGAAPATATLCGTLEAAAREAGLPLAFFTRLIWRESRFDPRAASPAGAQGVAQFMPATAGERGLVDPFEPSRALAASAGYLVDLHAQFGNWGLAAAAYNAGPGRVGRWLAAGPTASLPDETIRYVAAVTGHSVEDWRATKPPTLAAEPGFSCLAFAGDAGRRAAPEAASPLPGGAWKPWAVILLGSFNRQAVTREWAIVRATFSKILGDTVPSVVRRHLGAEAAPKFVVQIEADDRSTGNRLCHRLLAAGGNCVVLRNSLR